MTAAQQQTESSSQSSSAETQIVLLPPDALSNSPNPRWILEQISRHLAEPLKMNGAKQTIDNVIDRMASGHSHVWLGFDIGAGETFGCVVTEFAQFANGIRGLKIVLCGGDKGFAIGHSMRLVLDHIEKFAREQNCTLVMIEGRRGWGRVLPDYTEIWTTFEKELN